MLRFTNLWNIRFFHKYFKVQSYQGFTIVPFKSTEEKFKAYGLLQKKVGDTYMILYKEENEKTSRLYDVKTPLKFLFYVFCNDDLFLNYSDIELDHLNQCFLLANSYPAREGVANLHSGDHVSDAEKVIQVSSYNELDSYVQEDTIIEVGQARGEDTIFFSGRYGELKTQHPFSDLLDHGYFSMVEKDQEGVRHFYAVEQKQKRLFSILELTLLPGTLALQEDVSYSVTIGAKQVTWRYNIIEKSQAVYEEFSIYAGKHPLKLKPITKTSLGNGSSAFVLETSEPIVLCESYDEYYEVEFNQTDARAGKLTSKKRVGLPIPDVGRIKVSKSKEGFKAYSDMYIYL